MFIIDKADFTASFKRHAKINQKDSSYIINAIEKGFSWFDLKSQIPNWCEEILNSLLDSAQDKDKGHITELLGEYVSGKMEIDEFCSVMDMIMDSGKERISEGEQIKKTPYAVFRAKNVNSFCNEKIICLLALSEDLKKTIEDQAVFAANHEEGIPFSAKTETYFIGSEFMKADNSLSFNSVFNNKQVFAASFDKLPQLLKEAFIKNSKHEVRSYFLMLNKKGDLWFIIKSFNKEGNDVILISDKLNIANLL